MYGVNPCAEMLEVEQPLRELLRDFEYKPGWRFTVRDGWLWTEADVVDAYDHSRMTTLHRRTVLPYGILPGFNWTMWLYREILQVERHETGEFFMVRGERPFDPHK